jgi:transposase InsO family protein
MAGFQPSIYGRFWVSTEALNDVADYIDSFYNRIRRHSHLGGVSPEQFEAAQKPR